MGRFSSQEGRDWEVIPICEEEVAKMPTVQPKGEKIRQVVRWISERRLEDEGLSLDRLIQEGAARFNLSPKEEGFLRAFYEKDVP